jgi:hypothetical protein
MIVERLVAQSPHNHDFEDIIEGVSKSIQRIPTRVEPSTLEFRIAELERTVRILRVEVEEIKSTIGV